MDGSLVDTLTSLNLGEIYMLTVVYDDSSTTFSIYLNGVSQGDTVLAATISVTTEDLYIGDNSTNTSPLEGFIEEFRVYSRILTEDEITFIYEKKYGTQSSLAYPIYSRQIFTKEKYFQSESATLQYYGVVTAVEAQRNYEELGYSNGSGEFTYSYSATFPNFIPGNIYLHFFTLGSGSIVVTEKLRDSIIDKNNGKFYYGGTLDIGDVDYNNNTVTLDFDLIKAVVNPNSLVAISYATDYGFEYTEAGVYDNEGKMVAYTTFAPIKFKDLDNHLSLSWIFENNTA